MKKPIRMLLVACITTLFCLGIQALLTIIRKVDIYTYYFNTYYRNNQFHYDFEIKYLIVFIGIVIIFYYCLILLSRRKANKVIPLIILSTILIVPTNSYLTMNQVEKPVEHNSLIIGKGNPIPITLYTSYIDTNAVALANEIDTVLKKYIDYHKIELHVKFMDLESLLVLNDVEELTYDEYFANYHKSQDIKKMKLIDQKNRLKETEYTKRVELLEDNTNEVKNLKITSLPALYIRDKKVEGRIDRRNLKILIEEEIKNGKIN